MEVFWDFVKAFVVGGLICVIGQVLIQTTKLTNARILVLFVTAGVVLTGLGLYKPQPPPTTTGGYISQAPCAKSPPFKKKKKRGPL